MINLMLNYLRRPAGEGFDASLKIGGLPLNFDGLIALAGAGTAEKGKTAFLGLVGALRLDDLRIEHHRIYRSAAAFIQKGDDAPPHADHICCHADAGLPVGRQGV